MAGAEATRFNEERVVPDEFRLESARILGRKQAISWVGFPEFRAKRTALPIGRARDNEANKATQIPAAVAKLAREPIEQFGVGGEFTLRAKVIDGGA